MAGVPMPSGATTPGGGPAPAGLSSDRGPDYVYFERKPNLFGQDIVQKATAAKMRLELYYKEAVQGVVERKER
jgi:protein-serine/threonine kinase